MGTVTRAAPFSVTRRTRTGDTVCEQISVCDTGQGASKGSALHLQDISTAFLDAPFLATTPHGCDPPRRSGRARGDSSHEGGIPNSPFQSLTFTAFLDAPFLATTPHGCDPPRRSGRARAPIADYCLCVLSIWSSTNQLPTYDLPRYPREGEHLSRPCLTAAPVLHCGSPQPKARWSQERR